MAKVILTLGRGKLFSNLRFVGEVAGGGAVGPGKIYKTVEYDRDEYTYWEQDCRSGSKRSGSCIWQLEKDALYILQDIACSSSDSGTYCLSTFGDKPEQLSGNEFEKEQRRIWPLGYEEAERRRIELEALAELNAKKAADIAENGQPDNGLPDLTGTPKQIAYAIAIREAFAAKSPGHCLLNAATTAKYWIENHRSVLYN